MAVEFICDGCGKRQRGSESRDGVAYKPRDWYQRTDDDGTQTACSRECIEIIAEKTGKTKVVLPL